MARMKRFAASLLALLICAFGAVSCSSQVKAKRPVSYNFHHGRTAKLIDGVAYAPVDAAPQGVPTATLAHPGVDRELRAAAGVLAALDAGQRARVSSVTVASPDDVRFVINDVTVLWGGPAEGRRKAVTMAALLQQKGVRTINVSAPDSPVMS